MKKPKFEWEFSLVENNTALQIDLNGGTNKIIRLAHPQASQFIAEALGEVIRYQFDVGLKTECYTVQSAFHALTIARRHLERRQNWADVMDEANREYKLKRQQGAK